MTEEDNQSKLTCFFGESARRNVVLATTRWDYEMEDKERESRRKALSVDWGEVCRLDNSEVSAWELIEILLRRYSSGEVPNLQRPGRGTNFASPSNGILGFLIPWFRTLFGRDL